MNASRLPSLWLTATFRPWHAGFPVRQRLVDLPGFTAQAGQVRALACADSFLLGLGCWIGAGRHSSSGWALATPPLIYFSTNMTSRSCFGRAPVGNAPPRRPGMPAGRAGSRPSVQPVGHPWQMRADLGPGCRRAVHTHPRLRGGGALPQWCGWFFVEHVVGACWRDSMAGREGVQLQLQGETTAATNMMRVLGTQCTPPRPAPSRLQAPTAAPTPSRC